MNTLQRLLPDVTKTLQMCCTPARYVLDDTLEQVALMDALHQVRCSLVKSMTWQKLMRDEGDGGKS